MNAKRILFVFASTSFDDARGHEGLDALLVAAAFDQQISVLLTGRAVLQLLERQDGAHIGLKSLAKGFSALPMYDVTDVFVDAQSAASFGLTADLFSLPVELLSKAEQTRLINAQDIVFSC